MKQIKTPTLNLNSIPFLSINPSTETISKIDGTHKKF